MKLTYTEMNGYLIPDLILPETDTRPIGKYGELRREFIREHRPDLFDLMLWRERCTATWPMWTPKPGRWWKMPSRKWPDSRAWTKLSSGADPLAWAGRMNAIKNAAEEAVLPDLLYGDSLE